jgi:carboxypeptidase Taq
MSHPSSAMTKTSTALTSLTERARETALLDSINATLQWDQQTGMPPAASTYRAEQIAWLACRSHELWTAPEVGAWLKELEDVSGLTAVERGNVVVWRRQHERAVKLPDRLVEELARTSATAHEVWVEARRDSDFAAFAPSLARLVDLVREQAECWGYETEAYDALLEGYEPGLRAEALTTLFDELTATASTLAREGEAASAVPDLSALAPFPLEGQKKLNATIAAAFGYSLARGRIDQSAHPFCTTLGPADVRLTTRYDEADFTDSLSSVLHETGHGLYEQKLPADAFGTPAGSALYLGLHESQSRLWENHIGRSRTFWEAWFPTMSEIFPQLQKTTAEHLWRHVNRVRRSLIRVEADEVTYDLHIALRFRLERALFCGELAVRDLPSAWNEEYRRLFELPVPDDRRGCLQDVHWSGGSFGYFPTYSLGNLRAAQILQTARRQLPDFAADLAAKNYAPLTHWLTEHIYQVGSILPPDEFLTSLTGQPTTTQPYLEHLQTKITAL